ncbi:MAG: deoxyribodipyrimidine photo-lyase [Pseudomonadota bacterium]
MATKTICWFRQDLRLGDNPALVAAAKDGEVIPVFILDEEDRPLGGASKWWLHHSLAALSNSLGGLVLLRGNPLEALKKLLSETKASGITWNRSYEPHAIARDTKVKATLGGNGISVRSFNGSVIYEPWEIKTGSGGPYKVYSPFWRAIQAKGFPAPLSSPAVNLAELHGLGEKLDDWQLLPVRPDWASGWKSNWNPGEQGAQNVLESFLNDGLDGYGELRNRPDLPNVSRLSPHIHFGEISPRMICAKAGFHGAEFPDLSKDINKLLSQIGWRDFACHLLYHFPEIPQRNWKPAFDAYPWQENPGLLSRWQRGMTGYPMVDAGMRELWHTGYMHNRVRMLVASFLVKHLRIHWREGEAWFWDTLLDADLANNTVSWQWVTGSGADAAPYFRIFNPISQGSKFDPKGEYVRKWCPELSELPNDLIHRPFEANAIELSEANITLGKTYPHPIVDHKQARAAALSSYEKVKAASHVAQA